ncbi:11291_t:CDS:2 [Dentiscutata heterogama]|uniref:11291_t:CDS:1 n=1 Tax=Dentiscutata heterogama TaxID=1316150 RepID=A0ACA9N725_9GLOM|nr:11291_t:CDS:2 [Dentiscutata heterogama]
MSETWMLYKKSWLVFYTKRNINLDIRSSQCVKSLHSKLKGVKNRIIPIDVLFATLLQQLHELSQKQVYESFLHQSKHRYDEANMVLEKLKSVCLRFAFESFIKQQAKLAKSESYEVFKSTELNTVYLYIVQTFKQLPSHHHDAFASLMQQASEYIIEHDKIPELLQRELKCQQSNIYIDVYQIIDIFYSIDENKTSLKKSAGKYKHDKIVVKLIICISTATNCNKSQVPVIKHLRGRSPKNAKQK